MDVLAGLLGQAPGIAAIREQIRQILARIAQARRLPPILIEGETGTGKNLVASMIHRAGPRAARAFVDLNCAAIPEGLLEAELFGFERGAFTDARHPKAGLFQTASGGTMLLDEIALLSDALQAKLLTVIDERVVRRLGSTRSEPIDVCLIAATNDDLHAAVRGRKFREDLYHRLAVLTLRLPALRERREDIPALAEHFLDRACRDYGLPLKRLTSAAADALCAYRWPGNVRELANVVERVALLTETTRITPDALDLPEHAPPTGHDARLIAPPGASLDARVETWEREELRGALEATGWKVARAAVRLGLTRGTIRYRIAKYGLEPPSARARRRQTRPTQDAPRAARFSIAPSVPVVPRWEEQLVAVLQATARTAGAGRTAVELGRDFDLLAQKIESFGGRIEEAGASRLVAAFGLDPSEDAPRRAALAAMAVQNALGRESGAGRHDVAIAFAVHAERCPVAEVGGRRRMDIDARRRLDAELDALTTDGPSDTVVVSAAARALLGPRFIVDDLADTTAGRGGRLRAYNQHGFGLDGEPGPFVGRERELAVLEAQWRQAREGRGQLVAAVGEPGIGKSRLLFEFARSLAGERLVHLEGRGESYGAGVPYRPLIELLKGYLHVDDRDDPRETADRVRTRLLELDPALAPDVAPILALLDAPGVDPEWDQLEPSRRRQRMLDALKRLVLRASLSEPVLLVLEDLHWIDTETQVFLDRLVASLPGARVLLVVSYRPEYRHGWSGTVGYTQLHLDALETTSAEELVRGLVGADPALQSLQRLLIDRTEGNPFFLEESVRALVETRVLIGKRGAYRATQAIATLEVPATVRAMLAARIERLTRDERHMLEAAAVVGKDVPPTMLQAVADVSDAALRGLVAALQASEFLRETRLFPDLEYTFKHALTHEVAYDGVPAERRCALHARMVDALERLYAERVTEQIERLAHHATAAELWPKALAYNRQAGAKAAWRSAHREAVGYFERALRAGRRLPQTAATTEQMVDLYLQLRWSLVPLGEYGMLAASLREAEAVVARSGDRHRLGELANSMTNFLRVVGDCDGALAAGERARAIGVALGERGLQLRATFQLGNVHRQLGDYHRAILEFEAAANALVGDLLHERFGEPSVLSVHARLWLAVSLTEVGRFDAAVEAGESAIRIADEAKNAYSLTNAHYGLGSVHLRRGNAARAIELLERAVALCREGSFMLLLPPTLSALGGALTLAGRLEEASPCLEFALETAAAKGFLGSSSLYIARLAEARLLAGREREARELGLRALDTARKHKERGHEAWALYLLGRLDAAGGAAASACDVLTQALSLADERGMRPLEGHCHATLGGLYARSDRRDDGRDHLLRAAALFREMGMGAWLEKTESELAKLS